MSIKQNRSRNAKRSKKLAVNSGVSLMVGGESPHYIGRGIERSATGAVREYSKMQTLKLIKSGEAVVRRAKKGRKEIYLKSGERIVVTSDLKVAITYKN